MILWGGRRLGCGQPTRLWITQEALAVVPVDDDDVELVDVLDEELVDAELPDVVEDVVADVVDDPPSLDFDSADVDAAAFLPSARLSVR